MPPGGAGAGGAGDGGRRGAAVTARLDPSVDPQSVAQTVRQWKHLSALTQAEQEDILIKSVVDKARKQIGAPDRTIIGLIVQQSVALGVVGLGLGLVLILTVKDYFPRRVLLEPVNALALTGIALVVCVLASGSVSV